MTLNLPRALPALALLAAAIAVTLLGDYQLNVATYVMIYAIVCVGLVLMTGIAGMVSFGQAAFVGIGAYATGYMTTALALDPWIGLLGAVGCAGAAGLVVGSITVRTSGHYLALVTLCFCISLYFLIGNTEALGRFNGLTGIPPVSILGQDLRSERAGYLLVLAVLALSVWWAGRLLNSRVGRILRSLRTGPLLAETFGASAYLHRLLAFVSAAVLAAIAGWLYAHVQRFVNPTPFGIQASIEYLFMTVVGGAASIFGALLGAALVTLAKQELQELMRPLFGATTRLEMLVFAALVILVLWKARQGLWPMLTARFGRIAPRPRPIAPRPATHRRRRPDPGMPLLRASHLVRTFGGLVAVDDVSFDVRAGEILGLLGPNGAGKSTLFNLVTGVLPATSGQISFLGESLSRVEARQMCRRGVSRTFQHVRLIASMSVIENVAIGATQRGRAGVLSATLGLDRKEEEEIFAWSMYLLEQVGLADKAFEPAGSLPLGHQRVLEIARALAADPVLLLLDEPAAGLRAAEKRELARLLKELRSDGLGILLVEHDMEFVSAVADRLMVMNFGRRIAFGAPDEVRADADVQAAYLGVAA